MTHYDIHYEAGYHEAKHRKAIADIKAYLGDAKYTAMTMFLRKEAQPPLATWIHVLAPFAGVQGYPAYAWYAEIWPYG